MASSCPAPAAVTDGLLDLSIDWSADTPPFPTDPAPIVRWTKRLSSHGTNHQEIETALHVGTHLDAPLHWSDRGIDIASIPLDRLTGPAVVADISAELEDFSIIDPSMIERAVRVEDEDIVIVHTGYHRFTFDVPGADEVRYFWRHPGALGTLAQWAVDRRLRWIGFDMASPDHPLNSNLRRLIPEHDVRRAEQRLGAPLAEVFPSEGFQAFHVIACRAGVPIVENIGGAIDQLLGQRFTAYAFPWRFVRGEAAMVRVVADRRPGRS